MPVDFKEAIELLEKVSLQNAELILIMGFRRAITGRST
jgi:hypothetical protein